MAGLQSREELEANLQLYTSQLAEVQQLLLLGSEDEMPGQDLQDMFASLAEVIALTEELLRDASASSVVNAPIVLPSAQPTTSSAAFGAGTAHAAPADASQPSVLPASVAEQIKKAQIKAALLGQAPATWAVGAPCQAVWSTDGKMYNAVVESISPAGNFMVVFEGYGDKEEVALSSIRPRPDTDEGYKGVAAPKRKRVEDMPTITEVPKWLEIKPEDDEKTKARKKKLIKSYKSKMRFQTMDVVQKQKQESWHSFMKGKGTKKTTGFLTGTKKESIFSVGDNPNAKVGVVGSGKGMTEYKGRSRHDFNEADDAD